MPNADTPASEPAKNPTTDATPATAKPGDKGAADAWGANPTLGNEINPSDVIKQQQKDAT